MATLREIATHLGISPQSASRDILKMGIAHYKDMSLDEIRLAYLKRLRAVAAKHESSDITLTAARTQRELKETELLELKVEKEKGSLVDIDQLYTEWASLFQGLKQKVLGAASILKTEIDALYGIDLDIDLPEQVLERTLIDCSKHIESYSKSLLEASERADSASEDEHN